MGTNYYAVVDRCDCCQRAEEVHIGKSFYLCHATDAGGTSLEADWCAFLRSPRVAAARDEYGTEIAVEELIAKWVKAPESTIAAHMSYDDGSSFVDPDGYLMTRREFS